MTFQTFNRPSIHYINDTFFVHSQVSACLIRTSIKYKHPNISIDVIEVVQLNNALSSYNGCLIKQSTASLPGGLLVWNDQEINIYQLPNFEHKFYLKNDKTCSKIKSVEVTYQHHLLILGLESGQIKVSLLPSQNSNHIISPETIFTIEVFDSSCCSLLIDNSRPQEIFILSQNGQVAIYNLISFQKIFHFESQILSSSYRLGPGINIIATLPDDQDTKLFIGHFFTELQYFTTIKFPEQQMVLNKWVEKSQKLQFLTAHDEELYFQQQKFTEKRKYDRSLKLVSESINNDFDFNNKQEKILYKLIYYYKYSVVWLHQLQNSGFKSHLIKNTDKLKKDEFRCSDKEKIVNIHQSYRQINTQYVVHQKGLVIKFNLKKLNQFKNKQSFQLEIPDLFNNNFVTSSSLFYEELNQPSSQDLLIQSEIKREDKYLIIGDSLGNLYLFQINQVYDQMLKSTSEMNISEHSVKEIKVLQKFNGIGIVVINSINQLTVLSFSSKDEIIKLRVTQQFEMDSSILIRTDENKLFLALQNKPYTFSIFSYKSINNLVMKADIGINEHSACITCIDNDALKKWVVTSARNEIKIWNYKKILIANISYHEQILYSWFQQNDLLLMSQSGTISLIQIDLLKKSLQFYNDVSKECQREGSSQLLSLEDFLKFSSAKLLRKNSSQIPPQNRGRGQQDENKIGKYRCVYNLTLVRNRKATHLHHQSFQSPITLDQSLQYKSPNTSSQKKSPGLKQLGEKKQVASTIQSSSQTLEKNNSIFISQYLQKKYKKIYNLQFLIEQERKIIKSKYFKESDEKNVDELTILPQIITKPHISYIGSKAIRQKRKSMDERKRKQIQKVNQSAL